MRFLSAILLIIGLSAAVFAQNGSWWEPAHPAVGDTLTIFFDPTQSSEIPNNPSSLVLHWGVNETGSGNWQAPPQQLWPAGTVLAPDGIAARSPMSVYDGAVWYVKIPTDTTLHTLHFVVNTGTPQNFGSNWGHNTGGGNWNISIFQASLTTVILSPQVNLTYADPARTPVFAGPADTVSIKATAVTLNTGIDSLKLFLQGNLLAVTAADTLTYNLMTADYSTGMKSLMLVGSDSSGFADTAAFNIMINPPLVNAPVPGGIKDGINYLSGSSVTLSLFAPYKAFVYVIGDFNDWKVDTQYYMNREVINADSVRWWLTLDGLTAGEEYAFQYLVDGELRIADPYTQKVLDPWNDQYIPDSIYPNLKPYPDGKTDLPVAVLQTSQPPFNWVYSDTFQRKSQEKLVIYEMLLRDFLAAHDYATLTDTLGYFKRLGINAIELMPVNEFEGNSSWGYNPSFYFAPDKYYGTEENLKLFIDECHKNGIAVILDMVLNHSFGQSPLVRLYANSQGYPSADNPWFNPDYDSNWPGYQARHPYNVGYDFNHTSPATQAFVDRVNRFWLQEYKVDGFRFDLTKGFTQTVSYTGGGNYNEGLASAYDAQRINILERMAGQIWQTDSTAYVILEHFADNYEEKALSEYEQGMMLWGNLNGKYNEATMGYHDNNKSDFSGGYYGSRGWTKPNLVTYMESHDEERLMFKNITYGNSAGGYNVQDTATALGRIKTAAAFFLTYPGPKMIWQFGELGYDYSIDYNGRLGEKPVRWDYLDQPRREKLYKTFAALIKLRQADRVFTSPQTQVEMNVSGAGKRIRLISTGTNVSIIGNFDVVPLSIKPMFLYPGKWYDYFSGDSLEVVNTDMSIQLQPGEFRIYSDVKFETPEPGLVTSITTPPGQVPLNYDLKQNYPNPFNPETRITFQIPSREKVSLVIYDILGQQIRTLTDKYYQPGRYEIVWNGRSGEGRKVASGVYFLQMKAGDFVQNRRMVLLK